MEMKEWAKREVEIACAKERENAPNNEWDYGCACYESALKAFNCLCNDGHSGMSIGVTKYILNRLIDGKCLTPIEDTRDVWTLCSPLPKESGIAELYQCKRMSSLFKEVYPDGSVKYHDIDRVVSYSVGSNTPWYNGRISRMVHEMFPITMPYYPDSKPIKVYTEEALTDKKNGDFDMRAILYLIKDGEKVEINRFFDLRGVTVKEISKAEYEKIIGG